MKDYQDLHDKGLDRVQEQMTQSNVRPSLVGALGAPTIFQCVSVINTTLFGEEKAKRVLSGIEKGIQNENDEQLRILNERGMMGKEDGNKDEAQVLAEQQMRRSILELRDQSYDFAESKEIQVDEDDKDLRKKMSQDEWYLYQASKFVTIAVMRFSRKV